MKIALYTNILRVRVLARRCVSALEDPAVCICHADAMADWSELRAASGGKLKE